MEFLSATQILCRYDFLKEGVWEKVMKIEKDSPTTEPMVGGGGEAPSQAKRHRALKF